MAEFSIERHRFTGTEVERLARVDKRYTNWPVVYILNDDASVYVGETINAVNRMKQHLMSDSKKSLDVMRILVDASFNKSSCLDLESYLIRLFAGDGNFAVLNRNEGIIDSDYYDRRRYQETFEQIFQELHTQGLFGQSIPEIVNSDLFKLSPFKSLNFEQARSVARLLDELSADVDGSSESTFVIQGDPGTGKTIIAIYLIKLLRDIQNYNPLDDVDADSIFSRFFTEESRDRLDDLSIGFVVPQQSLRSSVISVFKKTPYLDHTCVLTPYDVGDAEEDFDLLIVDEAHRLNQRASQSSGMRNRDFARINTQLFGEDDKSLTQLDWILKRSRHRMFLLDPSQSVMPADLSSARTSQLINEARSTRHYVQLHSQMRVSGGHDYIEYVGEIFSSDPPRRRHFGEYDLRLFTNFTDMADELDHREAESSLARLVAGYAWKWKTRGVSPKKEPHAHDFVLDGLPLRWNSTPKDWVNSTVWMTPSDSVLEKTFVREVGSIHTVQGYDLNYTGVIIGPDLRFDPVKKRLYVSRENYFDTKGKQNNNMLGINYTDDDLRAFIINIYRVLMTRGIRGTYVYACDESLRDYLSQFLPTWTSEEHRPTV